MATLFAPDIEIARHHFFKHVAVAHFGANDFASVGAEGFIEAEVAHYRRHRSEEHTSELQSPCNLVCRLLLEKKNDDCRRRSTPVYHARRHGIYSAVPARVAARAQRHPRIPPQWLLRSEEHTSELQSLAYL